jgi:hypothetical protein
MCSKSNPLVVFGLDLMSAYEGEHMIFGLLGQVCLCFDCVLSQEVKCKNFPLVRFLCRYLNFFGFWSISDFR